jgi:hypothetical protein
LTVSAKGFEGWDVLDVLGVLDYFDFLGVLDVLCGFLASLLFLDLFQSLELI